jgi:hypothetical protein
MNWKIDRAILLLITKFFVQVIVRLKFLQKFQILNDTEPNRTERNGTDQKQSLAFVIVWLQR